MIATLEHRRHQHRIRHFQWQRVGLLRLRFPQRATMSDLNHQELFELASRIDEVCGRFEAAWTAGEQPRIESYLQQLPESDRPDLLRDLLANELELLADSGNRADESLYYNRFPEFVDVVKTVFANSAEHAFFGKLRDYELQQKLGEGGMGVVYKALHTRLKRSVAVKTLPPAMMHDPEKVARFHREMEAAGQIDDPHVVRAHDAGEVDGTHYLVMEFVDGLDLHQLQERVGPLSVPNACEIIRQAALGLQSAARAGLVHRDIKPSNLMLTHGGTVKILDLGLAQMSAETDSEQKPGLTSTGQIMGTFDYLSPEQATDTKNVDIRSDIYSLGGTMFKLLTGRGPYVSDEPMTAYQRIRAHLEDPIPSAAAVRADVPTELDALLIQMLAKQPDQRIQTPEELAKQLATFCDGHDLPAIVASATEVTCAEVDTASVGGQTVQYTAAVQSQRAAAVDGNETLSENIRQQSDSAVGGNSQTFLTPKGTASGRSRWTLPTAIVLTLAAGLGAYFSGLLTFTVKTDGGTIVLECDPAALQGAKIEVDGQEVRLTLARDDQPVTIRVDKRRGQLRITKAGFKVFDKEFDIALGDNEHAIKVRLDPLEPVVSPTATNPHRALAEWVLEVGGSVDVRHDGETIRFRKSTSDLPASSFTVQNVRFTDIANVNDAHLEKLRSHSRGIGPEIELHLERTAITDQGLAHLAGLTIWRIQLSGTQITDAGIEHLQNLKGQAGIGLSETRVSNAGVARIAGMPGIDSLGLQGTLIDDQALQYLRRLPNLKALTVSETNITDNGLEHLSVHSKLETLQLAGNSIGDPGIKHLAGLTKLQRLELNHSQVTDKGLRALADLTQLSNLVLLHTRITDESLKTIGDMFPQLESLHVGECEVGDDGLPGIGKLKKLTRLWIDHTEVTDAGLAHLAPLDTLEELVLESTSITDEGLKHLTELTQLRTLDLLDTEVTAAGVAELHKALPACRITYGPGQNPIIVDAYAQERRAAEWVLGIGGEVGVFDVPGSITEIGQLPNGPFRLEGIHLDDSKRVDDESLAQLAGLSALQVLQLSGTNISDAGLRHVESLTSLQNLHLDNNPRVTDAGLGHLKALPKIYGLHIQGTQTTDEGLKHLSQMQQLHNLQLGQTQITGKGLQMLGGFDHLEQLTVDGTRITDSALRILADLTGLKLLGISDLEVSDETVAQLKDLSELELLHLGHSDRFTDAGLKHLTHFKKLTNLNIRNTGVTDAGLGLLAELKQLTSLDLGETEVSDVGLKELAQLTKLTSLQLHRTKVTAAGVAQLHKSLPDCRILYGTREKQIIVASSALDRRAAEWVLSVGGTVQVLALPDLNLSGNARTIKSGEDLPTEPFRVITVDLDNNKKIDDAGLANLAGLSRITSLNLRNTDVSDAGVRHLEPLSSMQTLVLDNTPVSDEGIQHLKRMHKLEILYLHGTQITDEGVETLSQLPALQLLNVGDTQVTGAGLAMLKQLKQLRGLILPGANVADADLSILETFTELKILNVADLGVSDATLSRIATLGHLHNLSVGRSDQLTDNGLKHLAALKQLTSLGVAYTSIGDAGLEHLEKLAALKSLSIPDTNVTAAGIARLAKALPELEGLSVGQTAIGDEGLRAIGNMKLTYLQLDYMDITDTGLAHLSRLDRLGALILEGSPITDEGLKHLTELKQLRTLNLANTKVTATGVAELNKALPNCDITWDGGGIK